MSDREILGTVSQLVVAEILVLPYREKNFEAIARIKTFYDPNNLLQISEYRAGFMEESAMVAGEKNLKLMDAVHWHAAVSSHCEFFITTDLAFKSVGPIEVVQLSEFA